MIKLKQTIQKKHSNNPLYLVVGDSHGYLNSLKAVKKISSAFNLKHQLILLGDYIDRGPASLETLNFLKDWQATDPELVLLRGNHEQILIEALENPDLPFFYGKDYLFHDLINYSDSYKANILNFLKSLPIYLRTEHLLFVHGGIPNHSHSLEETEGEELLWTPGVNPNYTEAFVIRGHQILTAPTVQHNNLGIDIGIYRSDSQCLCLAVIEELIEPESMKASGPQLVFHGYFKIHQSGKFKDFILNAS